MSPRLATAGSLLAIVVVASPSRLSAGAAVVTCGSSDARCGDIPESYPVIPYTQWQRWVTRAASLALGNHARWLAAFSKAPVVVTSEYAIPLPRGYRRVPDKITGEMILRRCKRERRLLVVTTRAPRRGDRGEVIVDVSLDSFAATCEEPERTIFWDGAAFSRVILGRSRSLVLLLPGAAS